MDWARIKFLIKYNIFEPLITIGILFGILMGILHIVKLLVLI